VGRGGCGQAEDDDERAKTNQHVIAVGIADGYLSAA
jgi:hypothetical protein